MKVLLVNGPPRSGKDTVGEIVADLLPNVYVTKFARPLKIATHALYLAMNGRDLTDETFADLLSDDAFMEAEKEQQLELLLGLTPRQAYIEISERLMKPVHGSDVFGRLMVRDLMIKDAEFAVITDSGFEAEARAVVQVVGANNVFLLQMHRNGCDFSSDSRSYIGPADIGISEDNARAVQNDGTIDDLCNLLPRTVLASFGWK